VSVSKPKKEKKLCLTGEKKEIIHKEKKEGQKPQEK